MALTSRLWLRLDPETRERLEAVARYAHDSTITNAVRRLIHSAYDGHLCRGGDCAICDHRDAVTRRRKETSA